MRGVGLIILFFISPIFSLDEVRFFSSTQCPSGWEYYGQGDDYYLRISSDVDKVGTTLEDAFQGHKHLIHSMPPHDYPYGYSGGKWFGDPGWYPELSSDTILEISGYGTPRIANETRPKTLYILACKREYREVMLSMNEQYFLFACLFFFCFVLGVSIGKAE